MDLPKLQTIELKRHNKGILVASFNRPKVYNALNPQTYDDWLETLRFGIKDETIKVLVMTGKGKFFTSGQELALPQPSAESNESITDFIKRRIAVTKTIVDTLVTYPKILMVAVNGPALGFGVTSTALSDIVYAVEDATFKTPFMELALCVEACSSVLFPKALGNSKAKEMLFMGRTMTAAEWHQAGLVSAVFPNDESFLTRVLEKAEQIASYSPSAVMKSIALVRLVDKDLLLRTNALEMDLLFERMTSKDFMKAISQFMSRSKKSRL